MTKILILKQGPERNLSSKGRIGLRNIARSIRFKSLSCQSETIPRGQPALLEPFDPRSRARIKHQQDQSPFMNDTKTSTCPLPIHIISLQSAIQDQLPALKISNEKISGLRRTPIDSSVIQSLDVGIKINI